jgi:nitroimidazol reductase NimA-like FMN-containing flavoprotein (pyridoxamine 5'-phosphate oxidase superfamily)
MKAIRYEHPMNGDSTSTDAITEAGRYSVCPQYRSVIAYGDAPAISDEDKAELMADAREHGKFGRAPRPVETAEAKVEREAELADYERSRDAIRKAMAE